MQRSICVTFEQLTGRTHPALTHPTAKAFDEAAFLSKSLAKEPVAFEDAHLSAAALFFGHEIKTLRERLFPNLFSGMSRDDVLRLCVAATNRVVEFGHQAFRKELATPSDTKKEGHLAAMAQTRIRTRQGQMSPDFLNTAAIDTLPHWFAVASDQTALSGTPHDNFWVIHQSATAVISIEHALRDLWQRVLWEPWIFNAADMTLMPQTRDHAKLWEAWQFRQQNLIAQSTHLDRLLGVNYGDRPSVIDRSVSSAVFKRGRCKVSLRTPGKAERHRQNVVMEMIGCSYLADFLDSSIDGESFFPRDLVKAWLFLGSLAKSLVLECGEFEILKRSDIARLSFEFPISQLENLLSAGIGLPVATVSRLIQHLTCDPANLTDAFRGGLWHRPFVRLPGTDRIMLITGILRCADVAYVLERWLNTSGLASKFEDGDVGDRFEAGLRKRLADALRNNKILKGGATAPAGIEKSASDDEQIDVLIRCGNLVVVGEAKCLVRPTEPIDRYTYLDKLRDAAHQVERKTAWLQKRPDLLRIALNEPTLQLDELRFVPLVIVNNSAGLGLELGDSLVTDAHWFELILGAGSFASGGEKNFETGEYTHRTTHLYGSLGEFLASFEQLIARPPGLQKFIDAIEWETFEFPTSLGRQLTVHAPTLSNDKLIAAERSS